jgi:hypothetical protein
LPHHGRGGGAVTGEVIDLRPERPAWPDEQWVEEAQAAQRCRAAFNRSVTFESRCGDPSLITENIFSYQWFVAHALGVGQARLMGYMRQAWEAPATEWDHYSR